MDTVEERRLNAIDRVISNLDTLLRGITATPGIRGGRPNPAADIADASLTSADRREAARLMRVNHAGEVAAQGLYQGHAAVARDQAVAEQMQAAAAEELDHLKWCEQRLAELDAAPSRLRPVWYTGAWFIGAASGLLGDRWSLGFVEETERQVAAHLTGHLQRLPEKDRKSRAILEIMRAEEEQHGANARSRGARDLPQVVRRLMQLSAAVMTTLSYRI